MTRRVKKSPKVTSTISLRKFLRIIGPGIITGAADDDPSGITTYSQAGAQFGFGQLWTAVFTLPFLIAVQEACGRIGAVSGKGLITVIREVYSQKIVFFVALLVFIANTINVGADLGAMALAAQLLVPLPYGILIIGFALLILILEVGLSYKSYSRVLKWLSLSLVSYIVTVFVINPDWQKLFFFTFIPHIQFDFSFIFIITGVLGTTISPYMFFWQSSEEVEEKRESHNRFTKKSLFNLRLDTVLGMFASQVASWSIIVVSGSVLHAHGITTILTAADAAKSLEPLVAVFPYSGLIAKVIFSTGIIGLGLLAVPVLSASASYAVSEAMRWKEGLNKKLHQAYGFYTIIILSTVLGLGLNFVGINPITALIVTAVLNGIIAVPLLYFVATIASNKKIMGEFVSGKLSNSLIWLTFFGMLLTLVSLLLSMVIRV